MHYRLTVYQNINKFQYTAAPCLIYHFDDNIVLVNLFYEPFFEPTVLWRV